MLFPLSLVIKNRHKNNDRDILNDRLRRTKGTENDLLNFCDEEQRIGINNMRVMEITCQWEISSTK